MTRPINHANSVPMRERIITAVGDIFYRNGTYLVGVDKIVNDLHITRATLYRHFQGKEDLVVSYLKHRHDMVSAQIERTASGKTGTDAILAIFEGLAEKTGNEAFRGCAFLIAVTENPVSHAIHEVARTHKKFLHEFFDRLLPGQPELSEQLLILYEGVLSASVLRPEAQPARTAKKLVEQLLQAETGSSSRGTA